MELRPYQTAGVEAVRREIRRGHRRVVLVSPTGTGKTEMYLSICHGALAKGNLVLVLAAQRELLEQPSVKLDAAGQDHGVIQADHWRNRPDQPIQLASVQTLSRRGIRPDAAVVICDEAHLFVAETFQKIVADYSQAVIIGLTATPRRLDGKGLGQNFDAMVEAITIEKAIAERWLVPPRTYAPTVPDLSGVKTTGGDYQSDAASHVMQKPEIVGNIVRTWEKLAADPGGPQSLFGPPARPTIGFAVDIAHSKKMRDAFRAAGWRAEHVDGATPDNLRRALLADLNTGRIDILWNAQLLTLGVDFPRVSAIVMARPTLSETLYLQQGGRGLRPYPGKDDLLLLDHAGNCLRHGLIEWPREWSLAGKKKKPLDGRVPGLRAPCPECFAVMPAGALICVCGYEYPKKPRIVVERPGELRPVTMSQKSAQFSPEARVKALAKWIGEGYIKGYAPIRAFVIFQKVFGSSPDYHTEQAARALARGGSR